MGEDKEFVNYEKEELHQAEDQNLQEEISFSEFQYQEDACDKIVVIKPPAPKHIKLSEVFKIEYEFVHFGKKKHHNFEK